jgi:hypothetical protein
MFLEWWCAQNLRGVQKAKGLEKVRVSIGRIHDCPCRFEPDVTAVYRSAGRFG